MFIISVFELSSRVEEAVTALEIEGIPREGIKAVPMESRNESRKMFDSAHYSDNAISLALGFVMAVFGTFFGIIYGFSLYWGPILWGVIGAVTGFATGLGFCLLKAAIKKKNQRQACKPHAVIIVECQPEQKEKVTSILWTSAAMGVRCLG